MTLRGVIVAILGLLLSGCGADAAPVSATPGEMVEPPDTMLNGVAGRTATVCGVMFGGCFDAFDPPSSTGLPPVGPPYDLVIPEGTTVDSAKAWLEGPPVTAEELPFTETGVGKPPAGTYAIHLLVVWPDGSHVAYQWGVGDGE